MDLGPIREIRTDRKRGIAVKFDGVTAYNYDSYTDYNFFGPLAEERAKVWAAQHGGSHFTRGDGKTHFVKITRPKPSAP
jgi:hypothetical protein